MPDVYSVNQLKVWTSCHKRYELELVRKLRWPSNPKNFRVGKGVHQLLDFDSRMLPLEPIARVADEDITQSWLQIRESKWAKLPVLVSEWGFSMGLAGRWLYGRIDRVARDGDSVVILDWKTGTGVPLFPDEDWQTRVYLYAVYEAQKDLGVQVTAEQVRFIYVQVNNQQVQDYTVAYSEAMHADTRARLIAIFEEIETARQTNTFDLPRRCPDKYCPYRSVCGIEAVAATGPDDSESPVLEWESVMEVF